MTRLKIPKVIRQPNMAEERSEDRCCSFLARSCRHGKSQTYFIVEKALDHDQTPGHK